MRMLRSARSLIVYACGVFTVLAMIAFRDTPSLVLMIAAFCSIAMLATDFSIGRVIVYAFLFISAMTVEIAVVQAGIWTYAHADVFLIPLWIPFVWVCGGFVFIQFSHDLEAFLKRT